MYSPEPLRRRADQAGAQKGKGLHTPHISSQQPPSAFLSWPSKVGEGWTKHRFSSIGSPNAIVLRQVRIVPHRSHLPGEDGTLNTLTSNAILQYLEEIWKAMGGWRLSRHLLSYTPSTVSTGTNYYRGVAQGPPRGHSWQIRRPQEQTGQEEILHVPRSLHHLAMHAVGTPGSKAVTQESPPQISQLPTLKLRGPPDLPGKEFERYIAGKKR